MELTFTDGSKITISNGKDGAQGEQGLQGIQGPQGPAGSSIVPKFKVDADSYWMVSVDEGATYEYVLNEAGEKIKATGANASADDIADAVCTQIFSFFQLLRNQPVMACIIRSVSSQEKLSSTSCRRKSLIPLIFSTASSNAGLFTFLYAPIEIRSEFF